MDHPNDIPRREREVYDAIAEAYDRHFSSYGALFASDLTDLMYPQKGEAGLDIAGGTGIPGLKLAERVGREGSIAIIDISPGMLHQAKKNAAARQLSNVRCHVMDAQKIEFPDGAFDLATCVQGIQYCPDAPRVLSEAYRVLKPGGRIGFCVWSVPERFPLYSEPMMAFIRRKCPPFLRIMIGLPGVGPRLMRRILYLRGPVAHSSCRFAKAGSLEKLLQRAGFGSVERRLTSYAIHFETFEQFWDMLIGATPAIVAQDHSPEMIEDIRRELRGRLVNPRNGTVYMHNEAALVLARKP